MSGDHLRATKIGIAYAVDHKQEQNYDREEAAGVPAAIIDWINAHTEGEHPKIEAGAKTDWKEFNMHIRDGIMLCKLINGLLKRDGNGPVQFQKKVMSPFVAMTNIENFNAGCIKYGLPKESTFQTGDLWECRKPVFYNVITTLHALGFCANSKSHDPAYLGEISKTIDRE